MMVFTLNFCNDGKDQSKMEMQTLSVNKNAFQ